jgi:hypothetical protein
VTPSSLTSCYKNEKDINTVPLPHLSPASPLDLANDLFYVIQVSYAYILFQQ